MQYDYLDFDLEIGSGRLRETARTVAVRVLASPAGTTDSEMTLPFSPRSLRTRVRALESAVLEVPPEKRGTGKRLTKQERAIRGVGEPLFVALMHGDVLARYDRSRVEAGNQNKGLRIKLRIRSAELAALPWEFMFDSRQGGGYIARSKRTPVVRYLAWLAPPRPLPVRPPLRILGVSAELADRDRLDITGERVGIESAVSNPRAGSVYLQWLEGETWPDLTNELRRGNWHVVHFNTHGDIDPRTGESMVTLAGPDGRSDPLTATEFARLIADYPSVRLVVLNACDGARGNTRDLFSSAAAQLVGLGVPAVVAMQYPVSDDAGKEIARTFYRSLADGLPIDAALAEARLCLMVVPNLRGTFEWGTPVLYMHAPDGRLFTLDDKPVRSGLLPPALAPVIGPQYADVEDDDWIDALRLLYANRWQEAAEAFYAIRQSVPGHPDVEAKYEEAALQAQLADMYAHADTAVKMEDWPKAVALLRGVIEMQPDYQEAEHLLHQANRGLQLSRLYKDAQDLFEAKEWAAVLSVFERLHRMDPVYPDISELERKAAAAVDSEARARDNETRYRRAVEAMEAHQWVDAVGLLEELEQRRPGYRQTGTLLARARDALAGDLDPAAFTRYPARFRALLLCVLYELEPDRYLEHLPKLLEAVQDPDNTIPPNIIARNIAGIVGLDRITSQLRGLNDETRSRFIDLLVPVADAFATDGDPQEIRAILNDLRRPAAKLDAALRGALSADSDGAHKYTVDEVGDPDALSKLIERASRAHDPESIVDFMLRGSDAA